MKILLTADWHVQPSNYENTIPAMAFVAERVEEHRPDVVLHTGDVFHNRGRLDPTTIDLVGGVFDRILRAGASVVIVPGNHDAANAWGEIDSVSAVLRRLRGSSAPGAGPSIQVQAVPGIVALSSHTGKSLSIACVPCPSKYHLLARRSDDEKELSLIDALGSIYRGLSARAKAVAVSGAGPVVLAFHGGLAGATWENERVIGVGQDVTIPREFLTGPWDLMVAGHLHKKQIVGDVHYPGSLTQLTWGQCGYVPEILLFELRDRGRDTTRAGNGSGKSYERTEIRVPVAHPLVSIDVDFSEPPAPEITQRMTITESIEGQLRLFRSELATGNVRVKIRAPGDEITTQWDEARVREHFPEVRRWKFVLERLAPVRLRSSVTVSTPLRDLLDEWVTLNPELAPVRGKMIALGLEIDQAISAEGELPRLADYEPLETVLTNFKQFADARIDWCSLPRKTLIKGPNNAGKTNAARAEAYALFGVKALKGSPLRRVVRTGETQGGVVHRFLIGDTQYKIDRGVKLSSSGRPSGELSFSVLDSMETPSPPVGDDVWRSQNGANAPETEKRIQRLVGTPEMFFSTRFARQHEMARLINVTPAERKDVLLDAIQAGHFALLEERARREHLRLERALEDERRKFSEDERAAASVGQLTEDVTRTKASVEDLEEMTRNTQAKLDLAREDRTGIVATIAEAEQKVVHRTGLQDRIKAQELKVETRRIERVDLREVLKSCDEVRDKLEALDEHREAVQMLEKKERRHADLESDIKTLEERLQATARARKTEIASTESELEGKRRQTALLENVPCQSYDPGTNEEVVNESIGRQVAEATKGCQFLLDAVRSREDIPLIEAGIKELKVDRSHLEPITAQLQDRLQAQTELGFDRSVLARERTKMEVLNEADLMRRAQIIAGARGKLEALNSEVTAIGAELASLSAELAGIPDEPVEHLVHRRDELREKIDKLEGVILGAGQQSKIHQRKLGGLTEVLSRAKIAEGEAETGRIVIAGLEENTLAAAGLVSAVSRDGIPFLILERALPQLQDTMNALLDGSELSVLISPIRDGETGAVLDEVNILYHDANGEQVLEDASGQQANLLGLVFRAGVAVLQGDRAGSRPTLFIIDEGFGAYDPDNVPHAREVIHRLADLFGRVVYITHVPEVQEAAEGEIVVRPAPTGSTLEVSI